MLEHFEGHLRRRSERSKLYYEFPALEDISTPEQFRKCPVCCGDILGSSEQDASCSFKQKLMHHLAKHPTTQLSRYGLHQALLKDDYGVLFTPGYERRQNRAFSAQMLKPFHLSVLVNLSLDHQEIYQALFSTFMKYNNDIDRAQQEIESLHSSTQGTNRQLSQSPEMRSEAVEQTAIQQTQCQSHANRTPFALVSSPSFPMEA